jgi:glutamine synthetase
MEAKNVKGVIDLDRLKKLVDHGEIETVVTAFPDMYGRLLGKRISGRYFLDSVTGHGMHACNYLLACDMEMDPVPGYGFTSWEKGYGDFRCVPDLQTLRRASWLDKSALVLCHLLAEAESQPIECAPRQILRRQIERARTMGLVPMGATELEFFIFQETYESARKKGFHNLETYGWYIEDYHLLQGTKEEGLVGAIRHHMEESGVPVEFSKGEWGPGQHEINFRYSDFMETADRHVIYKHAAKELAHQQNLALTFMAKWDERFAGSSMHLHVSLWDLNVRTNLFDGPRMAGPVRGSDFFFHFLGGWMAHARELALLYAPYVNSYKRYRAGSFAPTGIAWARDNRTAGFRIVGHGDSLRIESRIPGADANPYLALAATLAAGLDGIENRIEPPAPCEGNVYQDPAVPRVPASLPEAIKAFEKSELARKAFGNEVVDHYLHFARTEQRKFEEVVTCWERERFFERV